MPVFKGSISLAVVSAGLLCCAAARAQTVAPPSGADRFTLDARASTTYDSNVTGGNAAVAALRNLEPADVTYALGATVAFQLPSNRQTFFVDGSADLRRHQRNSILNSEDYSISAGLSERLGICAGTGVVGYSRRQALIQDLAVAAAKNNQTQESANLGFTCGRRAVYAGLQTSVTKLMNDAKQSGFIDSKTETAAASLGYKNVRLGDISISAQYSIIDYSPDALLLINTPKVEQYGAGLTYSRKIGLRLSGTAGLSYSRIEGGASRSQSDGLGANASLAYRVSNRIQLTFDYNLGNSASPLTNASYVHSETLQLGGTYALTPRISLQAGASRSREDYRGASQIAILQLRQSQTDQINGGVNFKVGRKIVVTLDASHTDRVADISQFNFSDDRVSVGVTGRF